MKKSFYFGVLVLSLILISGCGQKEITGDVIKEESSVCNSPYFEFKKGECCLDQNSNRICDNDENLEIKPEIEKEDIDASLILVGEECVLSTKYLDCESVDVTPQGIKLKAKWISNDIGFIKEINVINTECSQKFDIKRFKAGEMVDGGLKLNNIQEFDLKCVIEKPYIDTKIKIIIDTYDNNVYKFQDSFVTGTDFLSEVSVEGSLKQRIKK